MNSKQAHSFASGESSSHGKTFVVGTNRASDEKTHTVAAGCLTLLGSLNSSPRPTTCFILIPKSPRRTRMRTK